MNINRGAFATQRIMNMSRIVIATQRWGGLGEERHSLPPGT